MKLPFRISAAQGTASRRLLRTAASLVLTACSPRDFVPGNAAEVGAARVNSAQLRAYRDTLTRMGIEDQAGRETIATAVARTDTVFLFGMMRADSTRSRWLRAYVKQHGWPLRSALGDSAAGSAWLILQHSPLHDFQAEMQPEMERLARRHEVSSQDAATLTDRVLGQQGKPQRYGTEFGIIDGKLVPKPVADLEHIDALRATMGLPPMAEYVTLLQEMYKVPVVWPPATK
jgi:hypothetical protein